MLDSLKLVVWETYIHSFLSFFFLRAVGFRFLRFILYSVFTAGNKRYDFGKKYRCFSFFVFSNTPLLPPSPHTHILHHPLFPSSFSYEIKEGKRYVFIYVLMYACMYMCMYILYACRHNFVTLFQKICYPVHKISKTY